MIELLNNLTPEQQAVVAGVAVSVVMWIGRHIAKDWFADQSNVTKIQKRVLSIAMAGFAAVSLCVNAGGCDTEQMLLNWLICWATSQGAHSVAKTRLR